MLKKIFIFIAICFSAWILGFAWFVAVIPARNSDDLRQTDAIVVLTGGSERLGAGLALLTNGYSGEMFVSGVGKGVTVEDLFDLEKFSNEKVQMLKQRIFLGYSAEDTYENGLEVANWVIKRNHTYIRLVTSNYHMPRSLIELESRLPDTKIISYPVFPQSVKTQEWWNYPGTTKLLFSEYMKYLAVILRNML